MLLSLSMSMTDFLLLFAVAAAAASSSSFTGVGAGAACVPKERDALLAFKQGVASDPGGLLTTWKSVEPDCCRWGGVQCSNLTDHVLELHLGGGGLTGEISHSLLSLQHLEHLNLSMNSLQGPTGRIPEFLGSLKNLRSLDLSSIPFSGAVPPQLGNLSKLYHLDLAGAQQMSSTDLSWLSHLPLLQYLNMESVNLGMVADWPYVVNMLPSLRVLSLVECSLTSANQSLPHLNLTNLKNLDLTLNSFHHPVASCWLWNLTSLEQLYLPGTSLYGQLPNMLGDMVSLQVLALSYNSNNLSMKKTNLKKLCNLTVLGLDGSLWYENITELVERLPQCSPNKLQRLYLKSNNLVGSLPDSMGHLTSLATLDLMGNNITGSVPVFIGNFTNLTTLDLSSNHLTGHVPPEIGMLANLTKLDLRHNDLDGLITEEHLDGLQSLKYIYFSGNQLKIMVGSKWLPTFRLQEADFASCQIGHQFPAWLKEQVDLLRLDISRTGITGSLPDWFCNTFSKVTYLDMSKNNISGVLPTNMDIMSLEYLYSSSNKLKGQIPLLPRNLSFLDISKNSLSGPLPSNFGAPKLDSIIVYSNNFSGQVPTSICELSLYALDLANNHFEGELPQCINMTEMTYLLLSNNNFIGNFPPFLRFCTSLSFLDLSRNRFSGTLPTWIGTCSSLQFFRLNQNMFYGHIPNNITALTKLYHLNLASNWISGSIPLNLSNLTFMTRGYTVDPLEDVPAGFQNAIGELLINTKRQQLYYHGAVVLLILSIDLSSNYLTGKIPEGMASLAGLVNLNLSRNQLSGEVPDKIGSMQSLLSLDLSNNNLSGEIPSSISSLTYLSILDLSNNNLTGRIPSGRQLDTLYLANPSMYDGNIGLCGPPLQRNCTRNNTSVHGGEKRDESCSEPMSLYFGLGIGYVVGLWMVFFALLFGKAWRNDYFLLLDKFYDNIYVFVVVTWKKFTRKADS